MSENGALEAVVRQQGRGKAVSGFGEHWRWQSTPLISHTAFPGPPWDPQAVQPIRGEQPGVRACLTVSSIHPVHLLLRMTTWGLVPRCVRKPFPQLPASQLGGGHQISLHTVRAGI